jgi:radical SAM protein with 4Fe4S-binding SPASM domain
MNFAVYGSLGVAEHVLAALQAQGHGIVSVVDQPGRVGQLVAGFTVADSCTLLNTQFDALVIATLDYAAACDDLRVLAIDPKLIFREVIWQPFLLQLEPTTYCNFSCRFCSRSSLPVARQNRHLDLDQYQKILIQCHQVKRIQLQGLGEPLLHPQLPEMLKMAFDKGIQTSLTTNGSLATPNMLANISPFLHKLVFSLDTVDEHEFARLRCPGKLPQIKEHIRDFCQHSGHTAVVINAVISAENSQSLELLMEFAIQAQIHELHLHLAENWFIPGETEFSENHCLISNNLVLEQHLKTQLPVWKKELATQGVILTFSGLNSRRGNCWWPFYGMFISLDGLITPCCIRMHGQTYALGNIFEKSMIEIWQGKAYRSLRQAMFNKKKFQMCEFCPK